MTVHREPAGRGYAQVQRFADGETIQPLAPGAPPVRVTEVLG